MATPNSCQKIPGLTSVERSIILHQCNATTASYPRDATVHELFEAQSKRTPNAQALRYGEDSLSYKKLSHCSNVLAEYLLTKGLRPGQRVAIYMQRSLEMVIAMLGIIKAGASYVPIDPDLPAARIEFMLRDIEAFAIISRGAVDASLQGLPELTIDLLKFDWNQRLKANATSDITTSADQLIYIMYTSGSTGTPKGVATPHRGVVNLILGQNWPHLGPGYDTLQLSAISFDAATFEIWAALLTGGRCVLLPGKLIDIDSLATIIERYRVGTLWLTASLFNLVIDRSPQVLVDIPTVVTGGEALSVNHVQRALRIFPGVQLINGYGPTEATVFSCCFPIPACFAETQADSVPIGKPLNNIDCYILDQHGQLVPIGEQGEVYLGGDGLATGYWNRAEITAEKFVCDPFDASKQRRLYKTGDRARYRSDGNLEYLGRIDQQIKLRGYRIEPEEIEHALRQHPLVAEAVVVCRGGEAQRHLAAYVRLSDSEKPAYDALRNTLRAHISALLPSYMVPDSFTCLSFLPRTPNGKYERNNLPEPRWPGNDAAQKPSVGIEGRLCELWSEVLGHPIKDRNADFFAEGGHSLLAALLASRVLEAFGKTIPLEIILDHRRVWEQAQWLHSQKCEEPSLTLVRQPAHARNAPSHEQQRLWFLAQLQGTSAIYNLPYTLDLSGLLDIPALRASLNRLVIQQQSLRLVFPAQQGHATTRELDAYEPLEIIDLRALPLLEQETRTTEEIRNNALYKFDLTRGPLFRVRLLRLDAKRHILLLNLHHIIADGWSIGVLMRQLSTHYRLACEGSLLEPKHPAIEFTDYATWQRAVLAGGSASKQLAWWQAELAGAPTQLDLPTDKPRPAINSHHGDCVALLIDRDLVSRIDELASSNSATPFMLLLATFKLLLARCSGQLDILVATPVANRNHTETEQLIGFFANTLVLRNPIDLAISFNQFLDQVRRNTLAAHSHQEAPLELLAQAINPPRSLSHSPLFQVMFALQNTPTGKLQLEGISVREREPMAYFSRHDLTLNIVPVDGELRCYFEYATDLFDRATIEDMAQNYRRLLEGIVTNPRHTLLELPFVQTHQDPDPVLPNVSARQALCHSEQRPSPPLIDAPRSEQDMQLEHRIARLMAQVLDQQSIALEEDFFSQGGSSLTALDLVYRIKKLEGFELSLDSLWLQGSSPRVIAATLRNQIPDGIVKLNRGGGDLPLFCLHTIGGNTFHYIDLARQFDKQRTVWGISHALQGIAHSKRFTIQGSARSAAAKIRQVQNKGPYILCGWSSGGVIALETARLLGAENSLLILIDTVNPNADRSAPGRRRMGSLLRRTATKVWQYPLSSIWQRGLPFLARLWAFSGYLPQPYYQPILLIRSRESIAALHDEYLGWRQIARGGLDLALTDQPHETILQQPGAGEIANIIARYVDNYTSVKPPKNSAKRA